MTELDAAMRAPDRSHDSDWRDRVSSAFPDWTDPSLRPDEWALVAARLHAGDLVTGAVVARANFGVWIDLGVGFAAMMEIVHIEGLTPEKYDSGDWCPIGSQVTARVFRVGDGRIALRQVDSNAPVRSVR